MHVKSYSDFCCPVKAVILILMLAVTSGAEAIEKPNIVLIFADDMGIDCLSVFNEKLGLQTPHLDRLAAEGMAFLDAHTTSAVCSPSRYGLLTGRYNWRSRLKAGIVGRWERPLIEKNRLTLPAMLQQQGYQTAMIGKWHLGFYWPKKGGGFTSQPAEIDFTGRITGGPTDFGFDSWFGDDVPNWPPYAWRENDRLLGQITTTAGALGLTKYVGVRDGPAVDQWSLEAVLPEYAKRCVAYIRSRQGDTKPFFLYFAMPSPHTPIAPNQHWQGKSRVSKYADFLLETDWAVGEILQALDQYKIADKTLVIFTTDNGTSPKANFGQLKAKGVDLTAHWRGHKADVFEGGHRVPFLVRWPGQVEAGSRSHQIISVADVMATIAEVVGHPLPANAAEDSLSFLPILRGDRYDQTQREAIVCHGIRGHFAIRRGRWKLLFCRGSGGWSAPTEAQAARENLPTIQLYDLEADPKETTNLYQEHPDIVRELTALLRRYIKNGRSTPGPRQPNHAGATQWRNVP